MNKSSLNAASLLATLPASKNEDMTSQIIAAKTDRIDTIIVLDDDPTGTQTVYDVPVLTSWTSEIIEQEFKQATPLFYILTNSRSLMEDEAATLAVTIGENIRQAATATNRKYWVISRSDSTLRGHYPSEVTALAKGLALRKYVQFIIPAFFEGGRYTINNTHYVQQQDQLIPANQTPYAQDKVFGYQSADLTEWIAEKTNGVVASKEVATLSIEALRTASLDSLVEQLNALEAGTICVVNAANYQDLYTFSLALLKSTIHPLLRTAASLVRAINGMTERPLLTTKAFKKTSSNGGLIVVGSYVPTSSSQLKYLLEHSPQVKSLEIDVHQVLATKAHPKPWMDYVDQINQTLLQGQTVVLYTSRSLVTGLTATENQEMGKTISHFVTQTIAYLSVQPTYLISKGGITSSDIATKGLGIQRAMVIGQIIKGVPVWQLGKETKFPDSYQIIFPGNVGTEKSLFQVMEKLEG